MKRWLAALFLLLAACAGATTGAPPERPSARLLALGDSYTIGEGVLEGERWPNQLAQALRQEGYLIDDPLILARTGWTTDELQAAIDQAGLSGPFDLVSLLIGVNNQYRGLDVETYRMEFRALLEQAVDFAGGQAERVIVLSIPDWGVTPFAPPQARQQIAAEIDLFNQVAREEAGRLGARYVDVTLLSRQAAEDETLLAADGLHLSGKMYAGWMALVLPEAQEALESGGE
jgi:lysophospholipase L1-like esterase